MDRGLIDSGEKGAAAFNRIRISSSHVQLAFRSGHIQQAFTPTTFYDQKSTLKLRPGDQRVHTALKIFVEFSEGTTFRVPTRETSKVGLEDQARHVCDC